jgi:CDGSH-type Zn-finger protein
MRGRLSTPPGRHKDYVAGVSRRIMDDDRDGVPPRNAVVPVADGPYRLRGDLDVRDETDGSRRRETGLVLCRCGRSDEAPVCDGSHHPAFDAPGVDPNDAADAAVAAATADGDDSGPLVVTLRRNGPVNLSGPVVLVRADGERSTDETALCRCGGSSSKPFCDGTHESVGFVTGQNE